MILIIFTPNNYVIAAETPRSVRPSEGSYSESSGTENGTQKRRRRPNGHAWRGRDMVSGYSVTSLGRASQNGQRPLLDIPRCSPVYRHMVDLYL